MTRVELLIWTINVVLAIVIVYTLVTGRRSGPGQGATKPRTDV